MFEASRQNPSFLFSIIYVLCQQKKNNIEMKLGLRSSFISTSFSIKIQNLKIDQRPKDHAYVIGESIGPLWRRRISTIVALFNPLTSKSPP